MSRYDIANPEWHKNQLREMHERAHRWSRYSHDFFTCHPRLSMLVSALFLGYLGFATACVIYCIGVWIR